MQGVVETRTINFGTKKLVHLEEMFDSYHMKPF